MSLQKNVFMGILLVTVAWLSFLAITYALSFTLFQAIENIDNTDTFLGILRVVIGVIVFVAWVYGVYLLTKMWLYKILLKNMVLLNNTLLDRKSSSCRSQENQ